MTAADKSSSNDSLGRRLSAARQAAGLTVRQLEAVSGVHRATISRLEHDAIDQPTPQPLARLARALELNAADLFLLADLPLPRQASLAVMLRTEYGLPPEAVAEAGQLISELIQKYDGDQDGRMERQGHS